jgi:hypothetical protein
MSSRAGVEIEVRDGEDHRDVALIGLGELAGRCADLPVSGCIEHDCHPGGVSTVVSALATKRMVNLP